MSNREAELPALPAADYTAAEVASIFRCGPVKIMDEAKRIGVGVNLRGRAGWRFSVRDIEALRVAMAPPPPIERRRRA